MDPLSDFLVRENLITPILSVTALKAEKNEFLYQFLLDRYELWLLAHHRTGTSLPAKFV
jgi:hypothetical protein